MRFCRTANGVSAVMQVNLENGEARSSHFRSLAESDGLQIILIWPNPLEYDKDDEKN